MRSDEKTEVGVEYGGTKDRRDKKGEKQIDDRKEEMGAKLYGEGDRRGEKMGRAGRGVER